MPEIPDLEAYAAYFNKRIVGVAATETATPIGWIIRTGSDDFAMRMPGQVFKPVYRHAKMVMFPLESGDYLVVHAMLTGRFQYAEPGTKKPPMLAWTVRLENGMEIRYFDERRMGRTFLTHPDRFAEYLPRWTEMGPDVLSDDLDEDTFVAIMLKQRGMIKNVITNERTIAGIGNAYSDEVLWEARLHPFRKRSDIPEEGLRRLFHGIRDTMNWATPIVTQLTEEKGLPAKTYRDHLRVHKKGGEDCPRCGHRITSITSGGKETNFCRGCQE